MSDVFRVEYKELTPKQKDQIKDIKLTAEILHNYMESVKTEDGKGNRHIAIAQTNLEQAVMWAVKGASA